MQRASPADERLAYERNIRRFYLFKFVSNFQLWIPTWVLFLQLDRGFSLVQVGTLETVFQLTIVVCEVPTGAIADHWGRKLSIVLGSLAFALGVLVFGLATSYTWVLISYLVWATAATLISGADAALLYDSLDQLGRPEEFTRALGKARGAFVGAGLLASLVGAPLAAATNLSFPILVSVVISLFGTLIALGLKEPPRHESGPRPDYLASIREALALSWRDRRLRTIVLLYAAGSTAGITSHIFAQPFLAAHNVPTAAFGILRTPAQVFGVVGSLFAWRLARRLGRGQSLALLVALFTGGYLVLAGVPSIWALAAFPAISFAHAALEPLSRDEINRRSPAHLRATLGSVAGMGGALLLAVTQPGFGWVADSFSLGLTYLTAAVLLGGIGAVAVIAWAAALRQSERAEAVENGVGALAS